MQQNPQELFDAPYFRLYSTRSLRAHSVNEFADSRCYHNRFSQYKNFSEGSIFVRFAVRVLRYAAPHVADFVAGTPWRCGVLGAPGLRSTAYARDKFNRFDEAACFPVT